MAQSVKCLLCIHEDLNLDTITHIKTGSVELVCSPRAVEVETRESLTHWPARLAELRKSRFSDRPCLKI